MGLFSRFPVLRRGPTQRKLSVNIGGKERMSFDRTTWSGSGIADSSDKVP